MRSTFLFAILSTLLGTTWIRADTSKPNLSGTWKLDPVKSVLDRTGKDLTLLIEETGQNVHIKEIRGPDTKDDVSEFTCDTIGKECSMQDGGDKAKVAVYYNGPVLVVLKTHGHRGDSVEKRRLSLAPAGDSLIVDIIHIEPEGKAEKLVFSKTQ